MDQGKRQSQMKDSGTFALIGLIVIGFILLLLCLASCNTRAQTPEEDEKVYININGQNVELVADEYDNQYLKQYISGGAYIYIPYMGPTDDGSDTLKFFNAKNQ